MFPDTIDAMQASQPFRERVINEVRRVAAERGMSNASLAEEAGVDPGTVGDFFNGVRWPQSRTLSKIAKALEISFADLDRIGRGEDRAVRPVSPDDIPPEFKADLLAGVNVDSAGEMRAQLQLLTVMYADAQAALASAEANLQTTRQVAIERRAAVSALEMRIAAIEDVLDRRESRRDYDLAAPYDNPQPQADPEDDSYDSA